MSNFLGDIILVTLKLTRSAQLLEMGISSDFGYCKVCVSWIEVLTVFGMNFLELMNTL